MYRVFLCIVGIIFSLWSTFGVSAECALEGKIAPGMTQYAENLSRVLSRISTVASTGKCTSSGVNSGESDRAIQSIMASVNSVWSFDEFSRSFRYWGDTLRAGSMPLVVERARQNLETERSRILDTITQAHATCGGGILIPAGTTEISALDGKTVDSALSEILKHHIQVEQLFRSAVLDEPYGVTQANLIVGLVPENFETDTRQSYASTAVAECKSTSGVSESIGTRLESIFSRASTIDTTETSWSESWQILNGSYDEAQLQALERQLLTGEMRKQGMSSNGTQIILGNLERYNTTGNRFVSSVGPSSFITGLENIQRIGDTLYEPFQTAIEKSPTTDALVENIKNLEYRRDNIHAELSTMYTENQKYITSNDALSIDQKTITDLIALHVRLMNINTTLVTDWIPKAEALCRSQLVGFGVCSYR